MQRILADILLIGIVLFAPWWVSLGVAAAFLFIFRDFYELIAVGLLIDLLYAAPAPRFFGFQFVFSFAALLLFVVLRQIKRRVRV